MDFNTQAMKNFDLRQLLGTWQLVGMATPEGAEGLRTGFTVKYGYISTEELSFTLNGKIEYVNYHIIQRRSIPEPCELRVKACKSKVAHLEH